MDYHKLSNQYQINRLTVANAGEIYELCATNPLYYHYLREPLTHQSIIEGIEELPPGKRQEDKYFLGFYTQAGSLVAILDLVWQYPDEKSVYFGLFMTNRKYQRQGISSNLIQELSSYIENQAMKRIRLGCIVDNEPAQKFWLKNGFQDTGEQKDFLLYQVKILERELY